MARVNFFFGTGSRYSYLAATQIATLILKTGATVRWRAVYSPDLIKRAGSDPFAKDAVRGQYNAAYRTRDALRWAAFLDIPYKEPDFATINGRQMALWAVAADLIGKGPVFGAAVLHRTFGVGAPPQSTADLSALAQAVGIDPALITDLVDSGDAETGHERNQQDILAAGGFGVPTFVVDDGELFWGQDRIPLLIHHLQNR